MTEDCKECITVIKLTDNFDKLYNLHNLALKAIIIIAFGEKILSIVKEIFVK